MEHLVASPQRLVCPVLASEGYLLFYLIGKIVDFRGHIRQVLGKDDIDDLT